MASESEGAGSSGAVHIEVQWSVQSRQHCPVDADIRYWAQAALSAEILNGEGSSEPNAAVDGGDNFGELTIRVVDSEEMRSANHQWRGQDKPTNVLSFPSDFPPETGLTYFGDMLVCADVLAAEASAQGKTVAAHWAHIVVHGTLHLLGYDHIDPADAAVMEKREVEILATLGLSNPYITVGATDHFPLEVSKS